MNAPNVLRTFKLWLEPDEDVPRFKRLHWRIVETPVADVLLQGIHPWMGEEKHYSLPEAFLGRLNDEASQVAGLLPFNLCWDVSAPNSFSYGYGYDRKKQTRFEQTLEMVQKEIVFVDALTYPELLEIAKERLRALWSHEIAVTLLTNAFPGFQEQRRFLKTKDRSLKLSGREDMDRYDLGGVLGLEDFAQRDVLLISEGIPTRNFRSARSLKSVTDGEGRLRLIPEIRHLAVSAFSPSERPNACGTHVTWHVKCEGQTLRFRPDLGDSRERRAQAERFAAQWRTDGGRLCFDTDIVRLAEMLQQGAARAEFPCLNYSNDRQEGSGAHAQVASSRVQTFTIGRYPTAGLPGEDLKAILRTYGVPMTGTKDILVDKLAELAAREYGKHLAKMDTFFRKQRFVRINQTVTNAAYLPVLEGMPAIGNLLVTMYLAKHLRGNAVLDPDHENSTYTEQELARALLRRDVALTGVLLRAN